MTFLEHFHLPHYFSAKIRKEIEHLYAAVAIGNLAQAIIAIFEPIFLYHVVGLSVTEVLLFMAAVYGIYALMIPFGGRIASRLGYARSIFVSVPFQIIYWFLLLGAERNVRLLIIAAIMFAFQKTFYWPALHASMSRFAKKTQRGREFSLMYAIMNLMQIIGPMIGGVLSAVFGIESIFVIVSLIYVCSVIPLVMSREKHVGEEFKYRDTLALYKKYPGQFIGYFGFGEELLVLTVWPIFIYIIVASYQDTGALVTVATLVATGLALYIGFYTDKHGKQALLRAGTLIYALTWLARVPVVSAFGAFITDTLSRTTKSLVFIPVSTLTYQRAEASKKIMPFVIGFEQMLAIGKFLACIFGMIIFATTGSFVALFIGAAIFSLFYFLV
ncbi:MAG TPA: MFS transporter [Patescibacteria group bacterium]|jgi:MFS family permease|nr:MFS transporter [Patescibacteria group bacterium]